MNHKEPLKNVWISETIKSKVKIAAAQAGISMQAWLTQAILKALGKMNEYIYILIN